MSGDSKMREEAQRGAESLRQHQKVNPDYARRVARDAYEHAGRTLDRQHSDRGRR